MNWYTLASRIPPVVYSPEAYLIAKRLLTSNREFMYIPGSTCLITGDGDSVDCACHMQSGGWSVHNHPGAMRAIPSPDDLNIAKKYKQQRMDIVATNVSKVIIMESPNGLWPVPDSMYQLGHNMDGMLHFLSAGGIKLRFTSTQKYEFTKPYYEKRREDRAAKRPPMEPSPASPAPEPTLFDGVAG